jgi:N6-L-threonylcarbamoyladenine synthase
MRILGIETSCDETSASIIDVDDKTKKVSLKTNIIATSLALHASTGGIIPEVAAREQLKYILPTINKAIEGIDKNSIDAIAVTIGPGLIGSLIVGVETAKSLAYIWNKPLIPVNHLYGHIYANWIENTNIKFPAICLVVSGGHTDLVLIQKHGDITWLGGTRDDAAGEAYDKIGRVMGLNYPAGPIMEKLASEITENIYNFPSPLIYDKSFDFSFSGLKAAAARKIDSIIKESGKLSDTDLKNISYSTQEAVFAVLIKKTFLACKKFDAKTLLLGGGVAANKTLKNRFTCEIEKTNLKIDFFVPSPTLCTDNAAMIATAAFFNPTKLEWQKTNANPELYFD